MKIQVTQDDLDVGKPNDCDLCPIALAAYRVFGCKVSVDYGAIEVFDSDSGQYGPARIFYLPEEAQRFVEAFDLEESTDGPFEFETEEKAVKS